MGAGSVVSPDFAEAVQMSGLVDSVALILLDKLQIGCIGCRWSGILDRHETNLPDPN